MAVILNIETSTEVCSVSLAENGKSLFEKENNQGMNHSALLTVFIDEIFKESKLSVKNIDAVAVSKGPGSYTGLRIGVSVAKGICYALEKPLIALNTLDVMADYTAGNINNFISLYTDNNVLLCPMIDAKRMEVYTALYDKNGETVRQVHAEIIDEKSFSGYFENNKILFFGNGAEKCKNHLVHSNALFSGPLKTSARFMQDMAERKYNRKEFEDVAYFEPFYLKDFVATVPKNKILK
ncbi:MAG: tRNA (adenosine(37)-N6)-threonylcarbamoyltransferase complex dimerization subunit type 1 TsaB [Bacteroidales bacterium]|jgi:tRNA threonylcarbamoyladenosine biosynthesis protein TsaB|nr:tRNA (adenosine(37)-N6)-threonylcarbamoyltransferase complex dimerization subunit type 1 TsaB [Bacteroidales bacterium]